MIILVKLKNFAFLTNLLYINNRHKIDITQRSLQNDIFFNKLSTRAKFFLGIFTFSMMLSFVGVFSSYIMRVIQVRENLMDVMQDKLTSAETVLKSDIHNISKMLNIIEELASFKEDGALDEFNQQSLSYFLNVLVKTNSNIMQMRIIDINGDEIYRLQRNDIASPVTCVDSGELQNKKHRYYFTQTLTIPEGEIWISDLDLNIEYRQIQKTISTHYKIFHTSSSER